MSKDLGSKDLSEEELDFGLLDESDDDIVEVEELADTSSKLRKLLHQENFSPRNFCTRNICTTIFDL